MKLPDTKRARPETPPASVRVLLAAPPKAGKTTLASAWLPDTTLLIDTQGGTTLLDGEHYVQPVSNWQDFEGAVDALCAGDHPFSCVVIDLISDVWRYCDLAKAGKGAETAASTNDYQNTIRAAEAVFIKTIGRLVDTGMGIWFLTHTREVADGEITRQKVSLANKNVAEYLTGVVQYVWLMERVGVKPQLITEPSAKFEAGGRTPVPNRMQADARELWTALNRGLNPHKYDKDGNPVKTKTTEKVAA
jgi:hypothetical protein